jgi:hypothetical protein
MGHHLEAFLMGVGIYGGLAAAVIALWGAATAAIIGIAAIFLGRWKTTERSRYPFNP